MYFHNDRDVIKFALLKIRRRRNNKLFLSFYKKITDAFIRNSFELQSQNLLLYYVYTIIHNERNNKKKNVSQKTYYNINIMGNR